MGVDYYSCDVCGEALYSECTDNCSNCGRRLCTECLDVEDNNRDEYYAYPYRLYHELKDLTEEEKEKFLQPMYEKYGKELVDEWIESEGINPNYCPYCNGSQVDNEDLFQYLLDKYNLKLEDVKEEYKKSL